MLQLKIEQALRESLKAKEVEKISALRFLLSKIKNAQIEKKAELTEDEILSVISKEVKERDEAIEMYKKGGREDLVKKEEACKKILQEYLPAQASDEEIKKAIDEVLGEVAENPNFGQVMGKVMGKLKGRADGKRVASIVKHQISSTK